MSPIKSVPVIDVNPFLKNDPAGRKRVVQQVGNACENIGFLVITGHGVSTELRQRTLKICREFFDLPEDEKIDYHDVPGTYLGYQPLGTERVGYTLNEETPPDLKAGYSLGRLDIDPGDPYYGCDLGRLYFQPQVWPERPTVFRSIVTEYYKATERLAGKIMQMFALALDLPQDFFATKINKSVAFL